MKRLPEILASCLFAIAGLAGCGSFDCDANAKTYAAAATAAQQCDPTAATPCVPYDWRACGRIGINPDAGSYLDSLTADFDAAGCSMGTAPPCGNVEPSAYVCQAGADGGATCTPSG